MPQAHDSTARQAGEGPATRADATLAISPDRQVLIVVGAMKCGTSSLHSYLRLHPEISMSRLKELNFFIDKRNWPRGMGWYRRQFDKRLRVWGESSPNYSKDPVFPGVPERMASRVPHATLVYVMRDPVKRALSHYIHNVSHGREQRPIDEALGDVGDPRNTYIASSRYHHQIQCFLRYYKRDALLLYTLDELSSDPRAVCRELFERLGVDPDFDHPGIGQVHHSSGSKRRPTQTARALARLPGGRLIRYALPALLSEPMDKPTMSDELRARLVEVLKPDTDQLRALWGRELAHWSC